MSTFMAFVLGLLIGWVIEWIIDWVYWRRRSSRWVQQENLLNERLKAAEQRSADLEHQLSIQKINLTNLQEKLSCAEADLKEAKAQNVQINRAEALPVEIPPVQPVSIHNTPVMRDDLVVIKGIGPVIAGKLNQVGIYSFADLAALTPERLREMVGDMISRLANEESILEQARQLAAAKSQEG